MNSSSNNSGSGSGTGSTNSKERRGTLTRADLATALQKRMKINRAEAAELVENVLSEIFESIVSGENVKLTGFGVFEVRDKKERRGRNPKNGVEAKITARKVVTFKPSNLLREKVKHGALKDPDPIETT